MIDINQWIGVLTKPVETFKKHKTVKMNKAFWPVVITGIIAGVIAALSNFVAIMSVLGIYTAGLYGGFLLGPVIYGAFAPVITIPVFGVIGWLVFSWLVDFLAKSSKKKSNFEEVASIVAMILPPVMIVSSILVWIPFVGFLLRTLFVLYALYLVALAMNEYYNLGYNLGMGSGKKK
jgi:hypothetical protein